MPLQDKVLMRKIKNREKKKIKSMKSKQEHTLEEESEYIALLVHRLLYCEWIWANKSLPLVV